MRIIDVKLDVVEQGPDLCFTPHEVALVGWDVQEKVLSVKFPNGERLRKINHVTSTGGVG